MNSPQTALFDKGRLLYGLDRARKPIRAADQAVIVEGYLDVIALHQAGFENVISPMGTALTEDQMRLLKRFTRRIVLALDPDAAGQKAVLRGLDAARASMDRENELGFDARGLIRHEARLQADLRVATMPDELDPDEIVQRDRDEWARLIAQAKPIVEHVLETLIAGQNVNDPKVKVAIAGQVMPLIEDLPNPIERDSYRQMLARRLRVGESTLTGSKPTGSPVRRRRPAPETPEQQKPVEAASPAIRPHVTESILLSLLLRRPDLLPRVDRRLQESSLEPLSQADFEYTDHQMILRLIQQSLEQDEAEQAHYVEAHLDESLRETYTTLMAQKAPKGGSVSLSKGRDDRLLEELMRQMIQLRERALRESNTQLSFLDEEAQKSDTPIDKFDLVQRRLQNARIKSYIDNARSKMNEYRRG
jgi:DNA primase